MNIREKLQNITCFLLDLDGTVYLGDQLIGDMKNTLARIRNSGRRIVYLTNNSSRSRDAYREKLKKLGIYSEQDDIYTSGMATIEYLKEHFANKSVYLVGTRALKEEFINSGIALTQKQPEVVVLAYDTTLTYKKLVKLTTYISRGAHYIATHPDINCPAPEVFVPDVGSFMELVRTSTGKMPEVICGKPSCAMGNGVKRYLNLNSENLLMVGDRLITDISFALNNDFTGLLVLSGETTGEIYEKQSIRADIVLKSLNDITDYL